MRNAEDLRFSLTSVLALALALAAALAFALAFIQSFIFFSRFFLKSGSLGAGHIYWCKTQLDKFVESETPLDMLSLDCVSACALVFVCVYSHRSLSLFHPLLHRFYTTTLRLGKSVCLAPYGWTQGQAALFLFNFSLQSFFFPFVPLQQFWSDFFFGCFGFFFYPGHW